MEQPVQLPLPMWRVQYQLLGGRRRMMAIVLVTTTLLIVGIIAIRRLMLRDPFPAVATRVLTLLTVIQVLVTVLGGANAVYRALLRDYQTKMNESHRLTPMSGIAVSVGYLFGSTMQITALFAVFTVVGAGVSLFARLPVGPWLLSNLILFNGAITIWAATVFSAGHPAGRRRKCRFHHLLDLRRREEIPPSGHAGTERLPRTHPSGSGVGHRHDGFERVPTCRLDRTDFVFRSGTRPGPVDRDNDRIAYPGLRRHWGGRQVPRPCQQWGRPAGLVRPRPQPCRSPRCGCSDLPADSRAWRSSLARAGYTARLGDGSASGVRLRMAVYRRRLFSRALNDKKRVRAGLSAV